MQLKTSSRFLNKANTLLGLQFLSDFGDQITVALLAACILDITNSTEKVGLVYFVSTLGYIVFTLVGGFIGDRLSKRNILLYSDLGRGFVVLLMIFALREKSISLIYCTSFLLAILGSLHRPVKLSIWAEVIPERSLERYNSLSEFSIQASAIVGPVIASFFLLREWTSFGFAIDAMTFFVCAIAFACIVTREKIRVERPAEGLKRNFLRGFSFILFDREMFKYVAYDSIQMIGFGAFNATFLVLAQRDFGWSKADYSYHLSILAILTTLGAFLGATNFVAKMEHITKLTVCALLSAGALGLALHVESFPLASIFIGLCDGFSVFTMAVTKTKVQLNAKKYFPEHLTSIIAARFIVIKIATLLGIGASLIVDDFLNLKATLALFLIPIGLSILPLSSRARLAATSGTTSPITSSRSLK